MLSTRENEILQFIQEFEISSLDYLKSKGTSAGELGNAYLQMQWEFLRTIMNKRAPSTIKKPVGQRKQVFNSLCN